VQENERGRSRSDQRANERVDIWYSRVGFFGVVLRTLWSSKTDPKFATSGNAAVAAVVAVFCALMGNPDQFQKISFSLSSGLVVEARQTLQQAQVTLAQLQKLGSLMGQFMIEEDAARGRLGSALSPAEHLVLRQSILDLLKSINLPDSELSKVASADRKWIIADYVIGVMGYTNMRVHSDKITEWAKIYGQFIQGSVEDFVALTPEKLEMLCKQFGVWDDLTKSTIEDYRYYLQTGTPRHSTLPQPPGSRPTP
jgi:hypothetical protein